MLSGVGVTVGETGASDTEGTGVVFFPSPGVFFGLSRKIPNKRAIQATNITLHSPKIIHLYRLFIFPSR